MARTRDSLRAGGVLLLFFSKIIPLRGPSPRRRGSVLSETRKNAARRSIPAQSVKIQRNSLAKLRCDHRPSRKDTMIVSRKTPFFWERKGGRRNLRSVALTMPKGAKAPQNSVKKPSATTFSLPDPSGIHAFCASGRQNAPPGNRPFWKAAAFPAIWVPQLRHGRYNVFGRTKARSTKERQRGSISLDVRSTST